MKEELLTVKNEQQVRKYGYPLSGSH